MQHKDGFRINVQYFVFPPHRLGKALTDSDSHAFRYLTLSLNYRRLKSPQVVSSSVWKRRQMLQSSRLFGRRAGLLDAAERTVREFNTVLGHSD